MNIEIIIEEVQKHLIGSFITEASCDGKIYYEVVKNESIHICYGYGNTPVLAWKDAYSNLTDPEFRQ